jgi:sugar phosphate isomerase/epimerase
MPGEGEFDLIRFREALRQKGYKDVVTLEILSETRRVQDPDSFAREAMRAMSSFWT